MSYLVSGVGLLDLRDDGEPQFLCHLKVLREGDEFILPVVFGIPPLIGLGKKRGLDEQIYWNCA